MKINAVISKPTVKYNIADKTAILSAGVITISIIVGAIIYSIVRSDVTDTLCEYFLRFTTDFTNKNKPEIISGLFLSNIPYLILMFIFGTSYIGVPAVFLLSAVKSIGLGMLTTFIYDTYSLKGVEYCLLVLFPGKFIFIFAMILLTQNCCINSMNVKQMIREKKDGVVQSDKYILRYILLLIAFMLSSAVDFLTIKVFSTLFNFT